VLDVLVDKSLVKISRNGYLEMHDQLRDLGRMMVETEEVYKGTRIWKKDMFPSPNGQTKKVFYLWIILIRFILAKLSCKLVNQRVHF
jgi:hypothetical protein